MADRKNVNKYYPPDWDPSKGSINQYVGQHPLRDRARKLNQGILIVRFEMPFAVWCNGCDNLIGKGIRFNAEKKMAGKYLSTKIWQFGMKCHNCSNWMEIKTDPEHRTYVVGKGITRKSEKSLIDDDDNDNDNDNGVVTLNSESHHEKLENDPFFRIENSKKDLMKAEKINSGLRVLENSMKLRRNDYLLNAQLRARMRKKRNFVKNMSNEGKKRGLGINLLPINSWDILKAQKVFRNNKKNSLSSAEANYQKKKKELLFSANIFANPT